MDEDGFRSALRTLAGDPEPDRGTVEQIVRARRAREKKQRLVRGTQIVAALALIGVGAASVWPSGRSGGFAVPGPGDTRYVAAQIAVSDGSAITSVLPMFDGELPMTSGEPIRLGNGSTNFRYPSLLKDGSIVYASVDGGESSVWRFDPETTDHELMLRIAGSILGLSPRSADSVAVLVQGDDGEDGATVYLVTDGATPQRLWAFPAALGRGATTTDEIALSWSPDGTWLAAVNTGVDAAKERQLETLVIMRVAEDGAIGSRVVRHGTHARWLPDGRLFYRPLSESTGRWNVLDPASDAEVPTRIVVPAGRRPVVSPDGSSVAIEDAATGQVIVFEIAGGELERIEDSIFPAWFSDSRLLVTSARVCGSDECAMLEWLPDGSGTNLFDLATRETRSFGLETSQMASVLYRLVEGESG